MKARIRQILLKFLGVDPEVIDGLRRDLVAHGKALGELHTCQVQLEEKSGITRLRVQNGGEADGSIVLVTAKEYKDLHKQSRTRAREQAGKNG